VNKHKRAATHAPRSMKHRRRSSRTRLRRPIRQVGMR
jgi:hypothetical protein